MKIRKIVVSTLLVSFLGLGMIACKKDLINPSRGDQKESVLNEKVENTYGISTDGNVLIFNTINDFDQLTDKTESMNEKEENLHWSNFKSIVNSLVYPKFKETKQYLSWTYKGLQDNYPSMLLNFLNKDGAVQIGNNVYRLDFVNKYCYVIPSKSKATAYSDLIIGNLGNKAVRQFTWDQEVVDIVENRFEKESAAPTGRDRVVMPMKSELNILLNANWNNQTADATISGKKFGAVLKTRYRWAVIFWDLYCKLEVYETTTNLTVDSDGNVSSSSNYSTANIDLMVEWRRKYKRKNKAETGWQTLTNGGNGMAEGQSYQGGRSLSKYIIGATAKAKVNGTWQTMNFNVPYYNVNGTLYQSGIKYGY